MFKKGLFTGIDFLVSFLFFVCLSGITSPIFSAEAEESLSDGSPSKAKYEVKIKAGGRGAFLYTEAFRPTDATAEMEYDPLSTQEIKPMRGGAIIGEDKRVQISNTNTDEWKVHGQLSMVFGDKTYTGTGTLVSPWHVLTAGHNLYDPKHKILATDVTFYAGRNGTKLLHPPVKATTCRVFVNWMNDGISELCGTDAFLSTFPIIVSGYPGDKPAGTMWSDLSAISEFKEKQFTYKLSTYKGQSGSNPWVKLPDPEGYYSLGTHASADPTKSYNIATRLTLGKLQGLVGFMNTEV